MTSEELKALFEVHHDEYIKFERVPNKINPDRHINGILLLQQIAPLTESDQWHPSIGYSAHDEITLGFDAAKVAARITEEQVITLVRCGVRFDLSNECFEMFV